MSLLGSGFRETLTGRMFGSTNVNGANPHSQEYRGHMTARMRNQFAGAGVTDRTASVPSGVRPPIAWVMAIKNGAMASRNVTEATFGATGLAVGGVTSPGSASISFTVADATGGLIASGAGTATFNMLAANALLTASINGTGSAEFTLTTNTPTLGALASGEGAASFAITFANAVAYPIDDASPLRDGTAGMSFAATLTPYAIGAMTGSTEDGGALTNQSIAGAVWNSVATTYNISGTMGEKVNASGSASNPWIEVIESGLTAAEILRLIAAAVQGSATGLEDGSPVFKSIDGTKDRITATYSGGTRNVTDRDAT